MEKLRKLQRGAVSIVGVAVGMTMLAVAVAGTSSALLYGRQALVNQEHYKVAVYLLRGELEEECAKIQLISDYRDDISELNSSKEIGPIDLDSPDDRDGERFQTRFEIEREPVEYVFKPEVSLITPVAYRIRMNGTWTEAVAPGVTPLQASDEDGETKSISLATSVFVRQQL